VNDQIMLQSTRGDAAPIGFRDAMLAGLAPDGGLYWPRHFPQLLPADIAAFAGRPYAEVAAEVIGRLAGDDLDRAELQGHAEAAYAAFAHQAVCPTLQLADNLFLTELFHGPTLAFKDVAMRLLARLMDAELTRRGQRATIVGATSGDTGSAAIDAFRTCDRVDVFILYPHGRVSDVQRRQMTTVAAPNVHALAIDGSFDDCQALVKGMFGHPAFRERLMLSGVNSINWARVAAQVVYYFTAAVALGAPHRPVSFAVPTGNFGNVLAGWVAKRMGLPIRRLLVATNANDILARVLAGGSGELAAVTPTSAPSMDIQVSSNFERVLHQAAGADVAVTRRIMAGVMQSRAYQLPAQALANLTADFSGDAVSETETQATIRETHRATGYVLDPHSAIGVAAARRHLKADPATPVIALATAHPAKFPDAVAAACGVRPALPPHLAHLATATERVTRLPNEISAVEAFIAGAARATRGVAA
jgi:threonine synthase